MNTMVLKGGKMTSKPKSKIGSDISKERHDEIFRDKSDSEKETFEEVDVVEKIREGN